MPARLSRAVRAKAQRQRISVSRLAERAIRKQLAQQAPPIPKNWTEVAAIDFSGFLDRDCEERIIFKTPQGALKARRSDEGKVTIEDVTREQVARWIHEAVLPEEFADDFCIVPQLDRWLAQIAFMEAHATPALLRALSCGLSRIIKVGPHATPAQLRALKSELESIVKGGVN